MIQRLLVANRGEIACRVFRTCRKLGIVPLAVYSEADRHALHVAMADEAVCIGPAPVAQSYLNRERILGAARSLRADAVHPGYGLLSENAAFATDVVAAGLTWVGPSPKAIAVMGDKIAARHAAMSAGVPVVPGSPDAVESLNAAVDIAERIGYPVMLKASGGGGGIGMATIRNRDELQRAFERTTTQAAKYFANPAVYLEKAIVSARHVEVQILGLNDGTTLCVGDRDCSIQRRHQKVLEEAPAPGLSDEERSRMHGYARLLGESIRYRGAGTVEMIMDRDSRAFYFLEMNTRLQVEHPVTELTTGVDLVAAQITIADGGTPVIPTVQLGGHAIEFRICAETPDRFLPSPGRISGWVAPKAEAIRVDAGYQAGDEVTPFYDSLLAKLCAWGCDRTTAIVHITDAAAHFSIDGITTTLPLVPRITADPSFIGNTHDTGLLAKVLNIPNL